MAKYIIRVEINNHDSGDYQLLHDNMASHHFYRVIMGDDGRWHDLPTGTYYGASTTTGAGIRDKIKDILDEIFKAKPQNDQGKLKRSEIIVSLAIANAWSLPVTIDKKKIPPMPNYLNESISFKD